MTSSMAPLPRVSRYASKKSSRAAQSSRETGKRRTRYSPRPIDSPYGIRQDSLWWSARPTALSRAKRRHHAGRRKPIKCTSGAIPENGWSTEDDGRAAKDGKKPDESGAPLYLSAHPGIAQDERKEGRAGEEGEATGPADACVSEENPKTDQ